MKSEENYFLTLSKISVKDELEKKGKFDYLSWPFAVNKLRTNCPDATWRVIKSEEGYPYTCTPVGFFVEVEVTVDGIALSEIHPVLGNTNKPIENPNAFHINTSIKRCLVKAIAMHGLGLSVYAGEDLPHEEPKLPLNPAQKKRLNEILALLGEHPRVKPARKSIDNGLIDSSNYEKCLSQLSSLLDETVPNGAN